jgi:hypothetical protein
MGIQLTAGNGQLAKNRGEKVDDRGQRKGVEKILSMKHLNLLVVLCIFLLLGCSSHEISTHEYNNKIKTIDKWYLGLTDEMETFEKALDSEEVGEIKSRKSVLLRCDVQLLDAIADNLVNKHQIKIVKKPDSTSGYIRIDSVCRWERYVSVDIDIYGLKQDLLATVRINNGEDFFVKNDEEFAEYCAEIIARIVLSK